MAAEARTPGLPALFAGFFGIGIVGFGGVMPWARRMMVDQRQWLSPAEFGDMLALCQFLPGPNIVNMAVAAGARFRGATGCLACVLGLMAAPMTIVIALGGLYGRFGQAPVLVHAFGGLAAAASGLVIAMTVKIAAPIWRHWAGVAIALLAFVTVAVLRAPLLPTMVVLIPASIVVCRRWPA